MTDLERRLSQLGPPFSQAPPELDELRRRAREKNRVRRASVSILIGVGILAAVMGVWTFARMSDPQPRVVLAQAPEVVAKWAGGPRLESRVAAAWATDASTLSFIWGTFRLDAAPPDLGGDTILLVATGESSTCPLEITNIGVDRTEIAIRFEAEPGDSAAGICTADFSPVTFVIRMSTEVVEGGRLVLDYGDGTLTVEGPGEIATVPFGL